MTRVLGFLVVRLPEWNEVAAGVVLPPINDLHYQGMDRWEWADVFDEDYYSGNTPADILPLAKAVEKTGYDFPYIRTMRTLDNAKRLESYSNRRELRNELIAIALDGCTQSKTAIEFGGEIDWIGYDLVAGGEWSLISGGIFMKPSAFETWIAKLNRQGLFSSADDAAGLIEHYRAQALAGNVEPLAPAEADLKITTIRVGRL